MSGDLNVDGVQYDIPDALKLKICLCFTMIKNTMYVPYHLGYQVS